MQTPFMRRVGVCAFLPGLQQTLAMLLVALVLLAWAPCALAHASLIASAPTAGAVLPQAPTTVRLTFNEPVSPLVLKIIQPDGSVKEIAQSEVLPAGLEVPLPALGQHGAYGLSWRVVSADGHPIGGTVTFSVGVKGASSNHDPLVTPGRNALIWLARLGGYIGLFFGIGLSVCHALTAERGDKRRVAVGLLSLGAAATLLSVGLLGLDALDRPASALLSTDPWRTAFSTSFGLSAVLALAALACAAWIWYAATSKIRRLLAAMALMILGASLAASGHASSAPPSWLARPAVWMHAIAITLWIGSLLPLAYSLKDPMDHNLLKRFSRLIPAVLLILFLSGGVLIYLQFDTPSALWRTAYGQVLALKLTLLAVLVGLGAYNRYRLSRAVLGAQDRARYVMQRVIYVECILAVAILAAVALWRFAPPPRASNVAPETPTLVSAHIHTDAAMADLSLASATQGHTETLTLYLSKADLTPLVAQEVDIAFSNAEAGVEPITFSAQRASDGTWQVTDIELPSLSSWHIRIDALITDFERISLETSLELQE